MNQERFQELRDQYGCGPIQFAGRHDALYERHLIFDHVIEPAKADAHEQFEATTARLGNMQQAFGM